MLNKKRAHKISGEYLGILTPKGLVPAQHRRIRIDEPLVGKEFGASWFLTSLTRDIRENLEKHFSDLWKELYTISLLRVIRPCSFRYISERYANEYLIFDGIVSFSKGIEDCHSGYNNEHCYNPQINLLYAFYGGSVEGMPAYYRKFPGNVREVSAFGALVAEMGIHDIVVIADKGFGSEANFADMDNVGLRYIVPLRRNSLSYDRTRLQSVDKSGFDGVFEFGGRPIWYYQTHEDTHHRILVYLDGALRLKEEKDYLRRLLSHHEGYTEEALRAKQCEFGILVLKTSLEDSLERIYELYKERAQIEQMFDEYKNLLRWDASYVHSDGALEGWFFLNHLRLMTCYRVIELLHATNSLKRYSVQGLLQEYLSGIRIERITGTWKYEVFSKAQKEVLKHLDLELPDLAATPIETAFTSPLYTEHIT